MESSRPKSDTCLTPRGASGAHPRRVRRRVIGRRWRREDSGDHLLGLHGGAGNAVGQG